KVRKLLGNIHADQKDTYEKVKNIILREYQITPGICHRGFVECLKLKTESMIQYASRLRSLLQCYLDARKVTTFVDLMDLMVSDHIKDGLTHGEKYYVGEKEADGSLKSIEIARLIDVYQAIRLEEKGRDKPKSDYKPDYRRGQVNESQKQQSGYVSGYVSGKDGDTKSGGTKNGSYNAQKPKSMAQVVMKEDKPNRSFQNNTQHKSTTYRTRKVEKQEEIETSNEETSSEGEEEQIEGQEEKKVMRVGIES